MQRIIFCTVLAMAVAPVRADTLTSTLDQALQEVAHQVEMDVVGEDLRLEVTRTVRNNSTTGAPDEATWTIDLPAGAFADALWIEAAGVWYPGELLLADDAARQYQRLTGKGLHALKDPALLYHVGQDRLALQVFPIGPGQQVRVRYQLHVPLRSVDGAWVADYALPAAHHDDDDETDSDSDGLRLAPIDWHWRQTTVAAAGPLAIAIDNNNTPVWHEGQRARFVATAALVDAQQAHAVRVTVRPAPFVASGSLLRVPLGAEREAVQLRFMTGRFSQVPASARVVFVVDTSRSVGQEGLLQQWQAVLALASHFDRQTRFAVITFARHAQQQTAFVDLAALSKLDPRRWALHNGSHADVAFSLARTALATQPTQHPRRIVLMSDGWWRSQLNDATCRQALGDGAQSIAHVVQLELPDPRIPAEAPQASPTITLAEATKTSVCQQAVQHTGGIVATLAMRGATTKTLAPALLHLVRPLWLAELHVVRTATNNNSLRMSDDDAALAFAELLPAQLGEHDGHVATIAIDTDEVTPVVAGRLWSKPITFALSTRASTDPRNGGFIVADAAHAFSPFEQRTLAEGAHAVSPVTSLLAKEPGVRPSRYGLRSGGLGGGGGDMDAGTIHAVRGPSRADVVADWDNVIAHDRRQCLAQHPTAASNLLLLLERGRGEIIDVHRLNAGTANPLEQCLVEAVWSHVLDNSEPTSDLVRLTW